MPWNRVVAAGSAAALLALAGRYAAGAARADRSWPVQVQARLSDLGQVDELSVLPLVERLIPEGSGLAGEPGVSYLMVRAPNRWSPTGCRLMCPPRCATPAPISQLPSARA